MKPKTKSWFASSIATVALVYSELIRLPLELISANNKIPASALAAIASFSPATIPGPGNECAFTFVPLHMVTHGVNSQTVAL